jgi:hypothetical protein
MIMTQVFELAAFTIHAGHEQALVDERPGDDSRAAEGVSRRARITAAASV